MIRIKVNFWPTKKLGEVLDYEQPGKYIVNSKNYNNDYKTPVLTAGKTFILGNTDEKENLFPTEKLPVIIFDDFTTAIKFVDFPFKVKSSAMKILHARKDMADVKYLFYLMQTIELNHATHKRYWISEYSQIKIPLPPLEIQEKAVKKIEGLFVKTAQAQSLRESSTRDTDNLIPATLSKIFEEGRSKGWKTESLQDISDVADGTHNTPKYHTVGIPLVTSKNLTQDGLSFTDIKFISPKDHYEISKRSKVSKGDLLIAMIGTIGNITLVETEKVFSIKNVGVVRPNDREVLGKYIQYYLHNSRLLSLVKTGGTTQKFISLNAIRNIEIKYPPISEQKKIVKRMDALTQKVRQLQTLQAETATNLTALKQSILHKAFEGKLL